MCESRGGGLKSTHFNLIVIVSLNAQSAGEEPKQQKRVPNANYRLL